MPLFLSPEWIHAADDVLRSNGEILAGTSLVVQQVITGGPDGDTSYHVVFDRGSVSVCEGNAERPTVTFTLDHQTAVAIGSGARSAQSEFMAGRLHLEGDASALLAHGGAMTKLEDVFGSLRAQTEF